MSDTEDDAMWSEESPLGDEASFLNPDSAPSTPAMPDSIWAGVERVLHNEQVAREATISLHSRRRPRRTWIIGAAAAGVSLLAVGVVVQSVQSSNGPLVASGANTAAPSPGGAFPAKQILASGTDYLPTTLASQVTKLVRGTEGAKQLMAATAEATAWPSAAPGFDMSAEALRSCIAGLTHDDNGTALMVDLARYHGDDAGIVVIPLSLTEPTQSSPAMLRVWVVGPDCSSSHTDVMVHMTMALPATAS
ncbi:MAG: hypothetical protein Q8L05_11555 [Actinomycetota bacterium]|nr:hypothetical protein [Actinomycetota bacterium]MDP2287350.1 hypothetical protein [Actinomycetota bacterium]